LKVVIDGVIIMSETESIGTTEMKDGFITIETPDCDLVKLEVGSYTSFDTLDEGKKVSIEVESSGATGVMYAMSIVETE
jgi:hypothetical protein